MAALPWHLSASIEERGDPVWMWRGSAPFCASFFVNLTAEVAAVMFGSASCGIASAILIPSAGLTTIGGLQRGCWGPRGGAVLPGHRGRRHDLRLDRKSVV